MDHSFGTEITFYFVPSQDKEGTSIQRFFLVCSFSLTTHRFGTGSIPASDLPISLFHTRGFGCVHLSAVEAQPSPSLPPPLPPSRAENVVASPRQWDSNLSFFSLPFLSFIYGTYFPLLCPAPIRLPVPPVLLSLLKSIAVALLRLLDIIVQRAIIWQLCPVRARAWRRRVGVYSRRPLRTS